MVKHELLYFSLKAKIESLPWPRRTISAGASSANPSNGNVTPATQTPLDSEDTGKNGGLGDDQVLPITVTQPDDDPGSSGGKDGKADENGDDIQSDNQSEGPRKDGDAQLPFTAEELENDAEMKYAMKRLERLEKLGNQADSDTSDDDGDKKIRATNKETDGKLLAAKKKWKESEQPDGKLSNYWVDVDKEDKFDKSLRKTEGWYKTDLSERGVQRFVTEWRGAENEGQRVMTDLDRSLMNRFVEDSFINWNWNSNERFEAKMNFLRRRRDREIRKYKTQKEDEPDDYRTKLIKPCKKERKWFRLNLEYEWMMGQPALLHGLKYDPTKDIFTGRFQFRDKDREGTMANKTEDLVVSEEWIK